MIRFHIPFAQLQICEHAVFTLLHRLRCWINLSSKQQNVSTELLEKNQIQKFFGPKILICLV